MKILNKTLLAGILFASALLSGCSDDEYTREKPAMPTASTSISNPPSAQKLLWVQMIPHSPLP